MPITDGRMDGSAAELHHIGFVVDDLGRAAAHFAATYGVGPFLAIPHVEFDELSYRGEACVWDHALAFARWGSVHVELQQVNRIEPPELAARIGLPGTLSHASYRVQSLSDETERLRGQGVEPFLHARTAAVQFSFFADPGLPTFIEVHNANPFLAEFDEAIAAAARHWDGKQALQPLTRNEASS